MEFFDTSYLYLVPLLLMLSLFAKGVNKYYIINIIAIVNILLIFNSVFIIRQYYAIIRIAMDMDIKPDPNLKIEIGWAEIRNWLIILFPFLFLIKPISGNRILTLFMYFLLQQNWLQYVWDCIKGKSNFYVSSFTTYHLSYQIIHYISWFALLFSICWFINYLPYSKHKINKLQHNAI